MGDYISREAVLEAIRFAEPDCEYEAVEAVPSADVQQVQYGEWIGAEAFDNVGIFYCGICGKFALTKTDFCPNCGARMGGEVNG